MAVISMTEQPDHVWKAAGWAFRQVLDDVIAQYPEDAEMATEFEQAKSHSGLILYLLPPESAARISSAILEVTTGILAGTIRSGIVDQPYGDEQTIEQYRKGLKELTGIAHVQFPS